MSASTRLDITSDVCPMTWVRVKLALEALQPGDTLDVTLNAGEPLRNVPTNCRDEGHEVLALEALADGRHLLRLRVGPGVAR